MPFSTGKEFLGYLFVMTLGFLDAFLLAHPSLILLTDNTFPELNFLTRLSTTTFLVLALLSVFYVATGMTLHGAAVKKRLLPGAFRKIHFLVLFSAMLMGTAFVIFNFTGYAMLFWPFKFGIYLLSLLLLIIGLIRLKILRRIRKWHLEMEK
ncbi:MAG TPA: hypothetical protein VIR29_14175 [Anseongella sp.]